MIRRFGLSFLAPHTVLLALACGGQTTAGTSNEGKGAACAELCQEEAACDASIDADECTTACEEDEVVSRDGQELLTRCLADESCEEPEALDTLACLEDGLFDLPISEAQEDFCTLSLERIAECGQAPLGPDDVDNCLSGVAVLSDEFVTELSECGDRRTCDSVNLCVGLKVVTALDEEQLQELLGGDAGTDGLGAFGGLEDLLEQFGDAMGGAGPG